MKPMKPMKANVISEMSTENEQTDCLTPVQTWTGIKQSVWVAYVYAITIRSKKRRIETCKQYRNFFIP